MEAKFVILLICLVYGVVAHPPAVSYLPPGGTVGGRPSAGNLPVPAPVSTASTISRPSASYLPPQGHVVDSRPISQSPVITRPVVSTPIVRPPVSTGPAPRPISPAGHGPIVSPGITHRPAPRPSVPVNSGAPRPISTGHYHGTGSGYGSRTVGAHAPY